VAAGAESVIWVTETTGIPGTELKFRFSRSSGPGGQHVNRTETRVELLFDLAHSPSLGDVQRERALDKLSSYVDKDGFLHLVSQSSRSQLRNREEVVDRFRTLMRRALKVPRKRRATEPPPAARERRLEEKKQHSDLKKQRGSVSPDRE
jgi:ribosome-associated protein